MLERAPDERDVVVGVQRPIRAQRVAGLGMGRRRSVVGDRDDQGPLRAVVRRRSRSDRAREQQRERGSERDALRAGRRRHRRAGGSGNGGLGRSPDRNVRLGARDRKPLETVRHAPPRESPYERIRSTPISSWCTPST